MVTITIQFFLGERVRAADLLSSRTATEKMAVTGRTFTEKSVTLRLQNFFTSGTPIRFLSRMNKNKCVCPGNTPPKIPR
jgi:hypothetical protein